MSILSTIYNAGRSVLAMVMHVLRNILQASYEYLENMHDFDVYAEVQDASDEIEYNGFDDVEDDYDDDDDDEDDDPDYDPLEDEAEDEDEDEDEDYDDDDGDLDQDEDEDEDEDDEDDDDYDPEEDDDDYDPEEDDDDSDYDPEEDEDAEDDDDDSDYDPEEDAEEDDDDEYDEDGSEYDPEEDVEDNNTEDDNLQIKYIEQSAANTSSTEDYLAYIRHSFENPADEHDEVFKNQVLALVEEAQDAYEEYSRLFEKVQEDDRTGGPPSYYTDDISNREFLPTAEHIFQQAMENVEIAMQKCNERREINNMIHQYMCENEYTGSEYDDLPDLIPIEQEST